MSCLRLLPCRRLRPPGPPRRPPFRGRPARLRSRQRHSAGPGAASARTAEGPRTAAISPPASPRTHTNSADLAAIGTAGAASLMDGGAFVGGQAGCNWQTFVAGLEELRLPSAGEHSIAQWLRHPGQRRDAPAGCGDGYSPRRKAIMAALTSSGRSCWVQWPQPGSMMVLVSLGTTLDSLAMRSAAPRNATTRSRSPAT